MDARDGVPAVGQAPEQVFIVEHFRRLQIVFLPGDFVQPAQGLIHAAVFSGDVHFPHLPALFPGSAGEPAVDPVRDPAGAGERLAVVQQQMAVYEPGQNLVQSIVGSPDGGIGRELLQQGELIRRIGA